MMLLGFFSTGATILLLIAFHWVTQVHIKTTAGYRLFLPVALSIWGIILWTTASNIEGRLFFSTILLMGILLALAPLQRPTPKNRRETKKLLEEIEKERILQRYFDSYMGKLYWLLLACLLWLICFRLLTLF